MSITSRLSKLAAIAVATFALIVAPAANAQKTTLVKDVDALGRTPYQQTILFNQTTTNCSSLICTINFNPVPAGYRLVINHVSAQYKLATGGTFATVGIGVDSDPFGPELLLPTTNIGFTYYLASSPVTFYVEAGHTPSVVLQGQFISTDGSNTAQVTVIGYLISTT